MAQKKSGDCLRQFFAFSVQSNNIFHPEINCHFPFLAAHAGRAYKIMEGLECAESHVGITLRFISRMQILF
jgi:hypothetical protein